MRKASSGWRRSNAKMPSFCTSNTWVGFQRAGIGGITLVRSQRHFGKGITRAEDVDDLLLARRIDPVDVDGTALHNIKADGWGAFTKKIFPLGQGF